MVYPNKLQDDPKTQTQRATREQLVLGSTGSGRSREQEHGGARKLTRSRSIPSNIHGNNDTPVFSGPLLPTVRRLHSTGKTVSASSGDDASSGETGNCSKDPQGESETSICPDAVSEVRHVNKDVEVQSLQSGINKSVHGLQSEKDLSYNKSVDDKKAYDVKSVSAAGNDFDRPSASNNGEANVRSKNPEAGGLFERSESPNNIALSSLKSSVISNEASQNTSSSNGREAHVLEKGKLKEVSIDLKDSGDADTLRKGRHPWAPTIGVDTNGSDRSRLSPKKALKNEQLSIGNHSSNGSARNVKNNRDSKTSPKHSGSRTPKASEITKQSGSTSTFSEKRDALGELATVRTNRGKKEDKSVAVLGSREARVQVSGRASSARESPSHPRRRFFGQLAWLSKLQRLFGKKYRFVWSITINVLLFILCLVLVLFALAMHDHILVLKGELTKLQEIGKTYSCSDATADSRVCEAEQKLHIKDFEDKELRRFVLFCSIILLFLPFLFYKFIDALPPRVGRSGTRNSEEKAPLSQRIAYRVDVLFSTHAFAKPAALLLATMVLILFGGMALYAVSDDSIWDALWRAWTYVADSGNHADSVGLGPRIVSLCISLGGVLIFALMLGLVSDAISEKVDSLRKGKSEVIENNHTLILGWSDKLGSLVKQLAIANQSLGGGVIVVLAERDKEQMELDITKMEFNFMGTSVICRSGSPLIMADLKKVSVSKARSIIVLAEVENADQSDARALRVVLSLTGIKEGLKGHVVVELSDLDNEPLVKHVGGEMVETVVAHDVIGRLMIQCARQPGLAQIWEDVLGFDHAEFYVKRWPQLDGMKFRDILISFPDAIPCGVKVAANGGKIILNPEDDYIFAEGDELLVIAEDDDTYSPARLPQVSKGGLPKLVSRGKYPEKILFCGWRRDMDDMIMVLEAFLTVGSELWIFSEVPEKERERKLLDGGLDPSRLENIRLVHREGNPVIRRHLESLPLETFDSILILADEALEESVVNADSRSLATLLLIRDIQSKRLPYRDAKAVQYRQAGSSQTSWIREMQQASNQSIIISEILDSRTKYLVSVSKISDYVLSNELVSMALAMVAEDKQINRVLEELFAEEGNEMYIRPAEFYMLDNEELSFYDIMIRAREREEIVIGYRLASSERAIINPPNKDAVRRWSLSDVFIALSQEE